MEIKHYANNPKHLAELTDLINYCQNIEANLDIKMAEQADIFEIEDYYQKQGGQFWIALHDNKVVGSIALLPFDKETAILKKFFTYPEFRGIQCVLVSNYLMFFIHTTPRMIFLGLFWIHLKMKNARIIFMKNKDFSKLPEKL